MMTGTLSKKIAHLISEGFKISHLNLKRSYTAFTAILGIIPVAYFLYLLMNANQKSQSVITTLSSSPYATVMLIVTLLDVVCAYTMWNFKKVILQHRDVFCSVMIVQTTIQLLLGNVLLFVVGLACLYFLNQVPKQKFVKFNQARVMLGVTSIFYLFCLAIIIKLLVH
ncbi:hypothetical protein ACWWTD_14825 [Lactiplantibacillus plantarum]